MIYRCFTGKVARAQMAARRWRRRAARRSPAAMISARGEARALGVDVGAQPGEQRREIAARDAGAIAGVGALGRGEELRRGHRAQAYRSGNSPRRRRTSGHPGGSRGDRRAARCRAGSRMPVVPRRRQVGEREIAGDQRALQPIAQDDMRRIGHLVGIDADEAALDPRVEAVEIVRPPTPGPCRRSTRAGSAPRIRGTRASGRPASRSAATGSRAGSCRARRRPAGGAMRRAGRARRARGRSRAARP